MDGGGIGERERQGARPAPGAAIEEVALLLLDGFAHLAFACAVEPMRIANMITGAPLYRWSLLAPGGRPATGSNGVALVTDGGLAPRPAGTRLFVLSGLGVRDRVSPGLLAHLRRERARGVRIGGLCSGAWVLAAAGFLDGRAAAIHWDFHDAFTETFPAVRLRRSVFVAEEAHVTAAGGAGTADLMLHLMAQRHGADLAAEVADQMVYNGVRGGDAGQRLSVQARHGVRNAHLARAIEIMTETTEAPLAPPEIAAEIGISTRQLERLFGRHLGCSPRRFSVEMRLGRARRLLTQTERSVTEIALACGFGTSSHFARVFRARHGVAPAAYRALAE